MRRSNLQTSRLLLEPTPKNATLELFISTPTLSEEYALGKLFGLIHIDSTKDEAYEIAITIRRETERRYYQGFNLKNDISIEKKFEEALAQLNETIAEVIEENRINLKLEQVHFILGVVHKRELHFTQFGNAKAYLVHKIKGKDYRPVNILESTEGTSPQTSLAKLFSNIISGEIGPNDALLFATETVTDYLSLDKLVATVVRNSASEANAHLATLLKEIDSNISFGALVLKYPSLPVTMPGQKRREQPSSTMPGVLPERSIADLAHTESKTEEILSPSTGASLKRYAQNALAGFKSPLRRKRKSRRKEASNAQTNIYQRLARKKTRFKSPSGAIMRAGGRVLGGFTDILGVTASLLKRIAAQKGSSKPKNKAPNAKPRRKSRSGGGTLRALGRMPRKVQLVFGVVVVLVVVLVVGSLVTGSKEKEKEIGIQFDEKIALAREKLDEADAALIYGGDEEAKELLLEAESLIKALETSSPEQDALRAAEETKVSALLNGMRRIENVADPTTLVVFPQSVAPGEVSTERFLELEKTSEGFLVLSNSQIYHHSTAAEGESTQLATAEGIEFSRLIPYDGEMFVTSAANQVFRLDVAEKKLTEYSLPAGSADLSFADATLYADRLYALDSQARQIHKLERSGGSFGTAQAWASGDITDLSRASSLAIDGDVFVLFGDATVGKYAGGTQEESFSIPADPALESPSKIFTSRETDFLYILDPSTSRLVVLTKGGKLISQFTSPKFDRLKDFVVDEEAKKIYLLNHSTVYEVAATHLP